MLIIKSDPYNMRKVYGKGINFVGQIDKSLKNYKKFVHIPELDNQPVKNIGCSYLNSCYFLATGEVIYRGLMYDSLSSLRTIAAYQYLPTFMFNGLKLLFQTQFVSRRQGIPYLSNSFKLLNQQQMIDKEIKLQRAVIGSSGIHLFDQHSNMYVLGENHNGERCTGDDSMNKYFRKVQGLITPLKQLGGESPSIIKRGQEQTLPSKQLYGPKISDVALGLQHSLIITRKGELYGCGKADHHQIPPYEYHYLRQIITELQYKVPVLIWNKRKVVKAACGIKHSVFMTEDQKIYTLGSNRFGQCGLEINKNEEAYRATEIYFPMLPEQKVLDIKCGYHSTLILTTHNCYYMGVNDKKHTNPYLSFTEHICFPTVLTLPARPIKIFANFDRSAIITADGKAHIFGGRDLSKYDGQSGKIQTIEEFQFNQNSHIGLGFGHTIIAP